MEEVVSFKGKWSGKCKLSHEIDFIKVNYNSVVYDCYAQGDLMGLLVFRLAEYEELAQIKRFY